MQIKKGKNIFYKIKQNLIKITLNSILVCEFLLSFDSLIYQNPIINFMFVCISKVSTNLQKLTKKRRNNKKCFKGDAATIPIKILKPITMKQWKYGTYIICTIYNLRYLL